MRKRTDGLLFKFGIMFFIFTLVTLILCTVMMYINQFQSYRRTCQDNIRKMGKYLESMIMNEKDDFKLYQDYFMDHYHDMEIPIDFDNFQGKKQEFNDLFNETYPGQSFGSDISFKQLTPRLQKLYAEYMQEYWLLTFEDATRDFGLAYCYYITISENDDDSYEVYYVIDAERTARDGSGGKLLHLADQYHHTPAKQPIEWKVWSTGETVEGFQEWDNEYGHTYSNYVPLIINGEKMGLVTTEVDVDDFNHAILVNTFEEILLIAIALIICVTAILFCMHKLYISKIVSLSEAVEKYSTDKNSAVAKEIENFNNNKDEISELAGQISSMIIELEFHIKNLIATHKELADTKEKANSMQALANKDALTGIRNKSAYDQEVQTLDETLKHERLEFGIAMIDLNFLKRINDTYGHEQGNIAIKRLCHMVCVIFDHSPVFRVGGDEFVVILKAHDLIHYEELKKQFEDEMESLWNDEAIPEWERISAAIGAAFFDPSKDYCVTDVFKRADTAMYERKKEMKAVRE